MNSLDHVDRTILTTLQRDGRIPISRLADQINLSETPCARRLKRLEQEGYIERYCALLSKAALGLGVTAFAQVRFSSHDPVLSDQFEQAVQKLDRIVTCHNISGSADYLLQIVACDLEEYGRFVREVIRSLPGVASVESMLSLQEVKRENRLPVD